MEETRKKLASLRNNSKQKKTSKAHIKPENYEELRTRILRLFKEKGRLDFIDVMDELETDDYTAVLKIFNELKSNEVIRAVKA